MILSPYTYNGTAINDGTNFAAKFAVAPLQPDSRAVYTERGAGQSPAYSGKNMTGSVITLLIQCKGTYRSQYETLKALFNTADLNTYTLIAKDTADSDRQWQIEATAISMQAQFNLVTVTLAVDDPVWIQVATNTETTWSITGSGDTVTVSIGRGNLDTYPVYEITPTTDRTGSPYGYRRFVTIYNRRNWAFNDYPLEIGGPLDTAALVTGGKMQADGDDLRVYVDGVEVDRWLQDINTSTTEVWINLDLKKKQEFTLKTAIASSGSITTIDVQTTDDISDMPRQGILQIGTELFTYTNKNDATRKFTGITRAVCETSEGAHSASDTVRWIEHEIYMYYGLSSATAPTADDTRKPMINLTSSNTSWDYDSFWSSEPRTAEWEPAPSPLLTNTYTYTAEEVGNADPASEMGLKGGRATNYASSVYSWWQLTNSAGITHWTFANGEKYNIASGNGTDALLQYNTNSAPGLAPANLWTTGYTIPNVSAASTWEAWSDSARALGGTYFHVRMALRGRVTTSRIEVSDVTLTLNSSYTPSVTLGAETSSTYYFNAVLKNDTTGESITINTMIALNETLQIDTLNKTVTYLKDNSNRYPAISLTDTNPTRAEWLRLEQGNNTLSYTESGAAGVEVVVKWKGRNN